MCCRDRNLCFYTKKAVSTFQTVGFLLLDFFQIIILSPFVIHFMVSFGTHLWTSVLSLSKIVPGTYFVRVLATPTSLDLCGPDLCDLDPLELSVWISSLFHDAI